MMRANFNRVATVGAFFFALSPSIAAAQPAPISYRTVPFVEDTGSFRGAVGPEAKSFTAFRQEVRVPGAPWVQLRFGDHNLGSESYVTVTSLKDGASQRLDSLSLSQWQNSTALFNGDAVKVELHVAPGEEGIFFRIEEVIAGETVSSRERQRAFGSGGRKGRDEAICGTPRRPHCLG